MAKRLAILAVVVGMATLSASVISAASSQGKRRLQAVARLKNVDGDLVALVRLWQRHGKVIVQARASDIDPAGEFHGFHVHTTGECDPESVDPATGDVVPFFSAGGHLNPEDAKHGEHAGDFPVLLVNEDETAWASFVTDRFKLRDLFDEDGSAIIIHAGRDNYANIPATTPTGDSRYHSHLEDVFGPDSLTLATGDAGSRFACGVVRDQGEKD
jgi:superoxide dismutase, Cu-Zn family